MAETPMTASLAALSRFFVGDGTVQETLERISALSTEAIPAAEMVGITMLVEGRQRTAVFTDPEAPEIDQAQYDTGEGPCLEAFRDGRITEIEDTSEPGKWSAFRKVAASHGIGSTLSFPLLVDSVAVGRSTCTAGPSGPSPTTTARPARPSPPKPPSSSPTRRPTGTAHDLSIRLGEAMQNRAVIEQAKGMLMAAQGFDEAAAFEMLVKASQRENVKLRDVARRIVADAMARAGNGADGADGADARVTAHDDR